MDIDYEAAMVVRAELRAQIAADIAARTNTKPSRPPSVARDYGLHSTQIGSPFAQVG